MNTLTLLVGVLLCMVGVYARHLENVDEPNPLSPDQGEVGRKHSGEPSRHRRRRWQTNYGYDYPVPPTHSYYPDRRNFEYNQPDLLPQIVKLLEEITAYVKRPQPPPPPPQPIYIPYPVPYPVPQYTGCSDKGTKTPNVTSRFPEMEDSNQNWGFVTSNEDEGSDDPNDGARPISFNPIKPKRPMKRPSPKVEHGSNQLDSQQLSTQAPRFSDDGAAILRTPSMCNAAILSCCADNGQKQKLCFDGFGCGASYDNGNACSSDSISTALESFRAAYSPVQ